MFSCRLLNIYYIESWTNTCAELVYWLRLGLNLSSSFRPILRNIDISFGFKDPARIFASVNGCDGCDICNVDLNNLEETINLQIIDFKLDYLTSRKFFQLFCSTPICTLCNDDEMEMHLPITWACPAVKPFWFGVARVRSDVTGMDSLIIRHYLSGTLYNTNQWSKGKYSWQLIRGTAEDQIRLCNLVVKCLYHYRYGLHCFPEADFDI